MGAIVSCWCPETSQTSSQERTTLAAKISRKPSRLDPAADMYAQCGPDGYEMIEGHPDSQGKAYKLMRNKRNDTVMVRFVSTNEGQAFPRGIEREIVNHRSLNHPNIVQFYEVLVLRDGLGIVSEYPPAGCLADHLRNGGPITESQAKALFVQLLAAMEYCHEKKIWHRDLKVENMFLDEDDGEPQLKIAGFAYSKSSFLDGEPNIQTMNKFVEVTDPKQFNTPPELYGGGDAGKSFDGSKLDIWGAGLSLFFMLTGENAFEDRSAPVSMSRTSSRIKSCTHSYPEDILLSEDCKNFIGKIFVADPQERPSIADLRQMPWLTGAKCLEQPAPLRVKFSAQKPDEIKDIVQRARLRRTQQGAAKGRRDGIVRVRMV